MSQLSAEAANERVQAILDEIEAIGIKAETEGRPLTPEEVARIETLSKEFDVCEQVIEDQTSSPGAGPNYEI